MDTTEEDKHLLGGCTCCRVVTITTEAERMDNLPIGSKLIVYPATIRWKLADVPEQTNE